MSKFSRREILKALGIGAGAAAVGAAQINTKPHEAVAEVESTPVPVVRAPAFTGQPIFFATGVVGEFITSSGTSIPPRKV